MELAIVILIGIIIGCVYYYIKNKNKETVKRKPLQRNSDSVLALTADDIKKFPKDPYLDKEAEKDMAKHIEVAGICSSPYLGEIQSFYDLKNLEMYKHGYFRLIGDNRQTAINDVLCLNEQLLEAGRLCDKISLVELTPKPFNEEIQKDLYFYTGHITLQLSFPERTESGKLPKHPVILYFWHSDKLFGEILYNQKGEVSRSRITLWQNRKCYILVSVLYKGKFEIKYIYENKDGRKIKLYEKR